MWRFALLLAFLGCTPGTWKLKETNDYFTAFNTDSNWTQGLEVSHAVNGRTLKVGQDIYTPVSKKVREVVPDERPYAGYLYGGYEQETLDYFWGVDAGIVGPSALGKQAQCEVHRHLGVSCPKGWPNQLHEEPALTARIGKRLEMPTALWILEGVDSYEGIAELGNVSTAIRMKSTTSWGVTDTVKLFAGPSANLVLRNIFLDGNTWKDSHSVSKKYLVADMRGGVEFSVGRWQIAWELFIRSPEFSTQGASYNFGTITISWAEFAP